MLSSWEFHSCHQCLSLYFRHWSSSPDQLIFTTRGQRFHSHSLYCASRCVGKTPLLSERWPHRVQNNPIHDITIDAFENEIKISRLNIHWYIPYIVEIVLSLYFKNSIKLIINKYKIESGTLMDTLRFVWRTLRAQIPMCCQRVGRCAFKHNWPFKIYLTARASFMNCWLPVGRRWRNRRQRHLVLNMCKFHAKAQWVTVTLTNSSVYLRRC